MASLAFFQKKILPIGKIDVILQPHLKTMVPSSIG